MPEQKSSPWVLIADAPLHTPLVVWGLHPSEGSRGDPYVGGGWSRATFGLRSPEGRAIYAAAGYTHARRIEAPPVAAVKVGRESAQALAQEVLGGCHSGMEDSASLGFVCRLNRWLAISHASLADAQFNALVELLGRAAAGKCDPECLD